MKTTVEISDALLKRAKRYAAEHQPEPKKPFKLRDASFHGDGMVKDFNWDEIMEITYEGRGGTG